MILLKFEGNLVDFAEITLVTFLNNQFLTEVVHKL
jgi:hypothetical protein